MKQTKTDKKEKGKITVEQIKHFIKATADNLERHTNPKCCVSTLRYVLKVIEGKEGRIEGEVKNETN